MSCWTRAHCTRFSTTSLCLSHSWTCFVTHSLSSLTSIARISTLSIAPLRSTTAHRLRLGSGAGKGPDSRVGWPDDFSWALRGRCADLLSRCALGTQDHYWTESSPQREIVLELLKSDVLQLEDGVTQLLQLIRLRLGKDLQQDVSEHYKRFLHRSGRLYQQSMQHYIAEESNLHERAFADSQIRFHPERWRSRDQGNHRGCIAWITSSGKRDTHRIGADVCLRCCWKELRVQSHRKRD